MALGNGRSHLAIPGPSVMPDRVLRAMHRAAPNIYAGELVGLTESLIHDLKDIAGCNGDLAIYHGNGHSVWEASLCNLFSRGDKVLALVTGRFGNAWVKMARDLGIIVEALEFDVGVPVSTQQVTDALDNDSAHEIKALLTVQTDTASASSNDIPVLRSAIDAARHPALFIVDSIASFACEPMDMQAWGVDVLLTASQKGLMTPPGLGLMFVGERVWEHHSRAGLKTPYWDMFLRVNPNVYPDHFCGTPPTHHLYGLREAVTMLLEEGMAEVWQRHRDLANCVWRAVDAWGQQGDIKCLIRQASFRSTAVTAIATGEGDAYRLRQWCEKEMNLILGVGLSSKAEAVQLDNLFRIGHMGHVNPAMLLGTLACIDAGFKALDIAHGPAALAAASQSISDAVTRGSE